MLNGSTILITGGTGSLGMPCSYDVGKKPKESNSIFS